MLIQIRELNDGLSAYVAWCEVWVTDATTHQPVTAVITINTAFLSSSTETQLIQIFTHELTHGLGFLDSLYQYYTRSDGTLYGSDIFINATKRGKTVTMLATENVVARARSSFGCSILEGLEVQDTGGSGISYSHWASRVMYNELMNPQELLLQPVYSDLTLALLQDSGWYMPNYTYGQTIQWGYQRGCEFFDENCIINEKPVFPEFCADDTGDNFCDFNLFGYGPCYMSLNFSIPNNEEYFSDKNMGGDPLAEYCPVVYDLVDCGNATSSNGDAGESFCDQCRCIQGTFSISGKNTVNRPSCHTVECGSNSATIIIGNYQAVCNNSGEVVSVPGLSGTVICPDLTMLCDFKACRDNCLGYECTNGTCYNNSFVLAVSSLASILLLN